MTALFRNDFAMLSAGFEFENKCLMPAIIRPFSVSEPNRYCVKTAHEGKVSSFKMHGA